MASGQSSEIIDRIAALGMGRVAGVVREIRDPELRDIVARLCGHAIDVRFRFEQIDLQPFDAARQDISADDILRSLVPQFHEAFVRVLELIRAVNEMLPPPVEDTFDQQAFDLAFAEVDGGLAPGAWSPPQEDRSLELDNLLDDILAEQDTGDAKEAVLQRLRGITWQVSGLFKAELGQLRKRLGLEAVARNRWNLLGELHEVQHTMIKGSGAIVVGLCSAFAPVRKQDLFPNYATQLQNALRLRTFVFLLRDVISDLRSRMDEAAEEQWRNYADAAYTHLEAHAFDATLGQMRPLDKKTLIELRNRLFVALADPNSAARGFLEIMDDARNFLEALGEINHRETLVEHDHEAFNMALLHLQSAVRADADNAEASLSSAIEAMQKAAGRDRVVDTMVAKAAEAAGTLDPEEAIREVSRVLTALNE